MFGFHDEDSDWDVYSVHVTPSVELFTLNKPELVFTTPETKLYNKLISVKVEDVEHVFHQIIDGDMKTFERIFSPEVIMKTEQSRFRTIRCKKVYQPKYAGELLGTRERLFGFL